MHSDIIKVKRIYGALAKVHAERNFVLFPEVRATDYRRLLDMITVRAPDGRQETTQLGGSLPESLARMMLIELEVQKTGK